MKTSFLLLILLALPAAASFRFVKSDGGIELLDDDKLVTAYCTDWRVPYLYPVMSPSGANVTRHWPMSDEFKSEERDHPHHRSLWMAHGAVNGYDFWAFHDKKDAAIKHLAFTGDFIGKDGSATFSADLAWTAGGKTHLLEKRVHHFKKSGAATLIIEITSTLTAADGDVLFGDTKEGMFALRVDRTLRLKGDEAEGHLANSEGLADDAVWGRRSKWISASGPDETNKPAVVALFDHPSNLRHPSWWHARDYGLLAANPFGIHDFENKEDKTLGNHTLKKGESLTFRYAVVVHEGKQDSIDLEALWKAFSKTPNP